MHVKVRSDASVPRPTKTHPWRLIQISGCLKELRQESAVELVLSTTGSLHGQHRQSACQSIWNT